MSSPQPLDAAQVAHVAKLARLAMDAGRVEAFRTQLAAVLGHIALLDSVDIAGVEPMAHPFDASNRLAEDEPSTSMTVEDLLMNAPATEGRFLAVPKVLADEE